MKNFLLSLFLFSSISQAQTILSPAPVNGDIELSKINSYIHFTNPTTSQVPLNLSLGSNSHGIKLGVTRCGPPVRKYQSCYVIVSFQNYIYNTQEISVPLMNGSTQLANLVFHPVTSQDQGSVFSVSSMSLNNFDLVSVVIQNKTSSTKSYNPVLSGIDSSKYSILLNRCSGNVIHNGTCLVYFKLNPQTPGVYSAVLSEPQVTNSVTLTSIIAGSTQGVVPTPIESISVSPSFLSFGTIRNLGKTAPKSITITNNGNVAVSPIVSVSGSGLEIALNRCLILLSPNQSCTVSVVMNVTSSLFNGVQSGLFISSQASLTTSQIFTPISATLDVEPTLIGSDPGGVGGSYNPTFSSYAPSLNICDGTVPQTRTITSCFGTSENTFVSTSLCTDPAPSILGQSPAGDIVENITSGTETYHCDLGSNIKQLVSRTCFLPSLDNGEFCSIDLIYFGARTATSSSYNLFVSDGTAAGTISVKPIIDGGPSVNDFEFYNINGKAYFKGSDPVNGIEPWVSNGTAAGTYMLKDINPGTDTSSISPFYRLNKTQILFLANDGTHGIELWSTDGTSLGTNMVKDIFVGSSSSASGSFLSFFAILNGKALFAARSSTSVGTELWITDGTEIGTYMLKDLRPVANRSSLPAGFITFKNKVFFAAQTDENGIEIWVSDGTVAGTQLFKDINGNSLSSVASNPSFTILGNELFFLAADTVNGNELWKTDGTPSGTVMVKNINPTGSSNILSLKSSGNKLYFYADDGTTGLEPWVSDGTSAGTFLLKDILVGSVTSSPPGSGTLFNYYNGLTYFRARTTLSSINMYVTDGTPAGTYLFNNDSTLTITNSNFVTLNNKLYFKGNTGPTGAELFVTDGTSAGTGLVTDINEPPAGLNGVSSILGQIYLIQLTPVVP